MMKKHNYTDKESAEIYCGLGITVFDIAMGLITVTQFWHSWGLGLFFTVLACHIIIWANFKKYRYAKKFEDTKLSKSRVCYIDSAICVINLVFLWVYLFIPIPFSLEAFLHPEEGLIFPFTNFIIGALSLTPLIITNKRILKYYKETD